MQEEKRTKLLILTQKVDSRDSILGFFHRWIEEFAKHCGQVTVIALGVGEYHLPKNVRVFSLGKERGASRLKYIINFYRLIWRERKNYDAVFVHMNQVYALLGGLVWRVLRKPVGLWYVHRANTFSLWLAEKFIDVVFTSRKEGFTIATNKSMYLGHGIDVGVAVRPRGYREKRDDRAILCVGRLTPIKDQETIIRACGILAREGVPFTGVFVGDSVTEKDKEYKKNLLNLVLKEEIKDRVFFKGNVKQENLFPFYWKSGIHMNACPTGGLDKVVIEGILGGAIPLVANETFRDAFGEYADRLIFRHNDAESLAKHIKDILESNDKEIIRVTLEKKARETFDLSILIKKIINWYEASQ
ncbi:MAG: glycosyltransferase family 4 protein [Candidatus Yonathbacteria bacterium]|nr:glycosyltransferase family 4 protein [Candidatus Yonathbacteria bacterium]